MSMSTRTPIGRSALASAASASTRPRSRPRRRGRRPARRAATSRPIIVGATTGVVTQDAVEPRRGHDLGLAHGGAAQADGARLDLTAGDLRRLVRLDVRPQLAAGVGNGVRHRPQVRLERVQVEEQRGGRQLLRRSRRLRSGLRSGLGSSAGLPGFVAHAGAIVTVPARRAAGLEHDRPRGMVRRAPRG